jgi:hypothetical protein
MADCTRIIQDDFPLRYVVNLSGQLIDDGDQ